VVYFAPKYAQNPYVDLSELIHVCTRIDKKLIEGRNILAIIDESIITLLGCFLNKEDLKELLGIGGNNSAPGTHAVSCLLMDADSKAILGLCEILMYKVPKASNDPKENVKNQKLRQGHLDFKDRASSSWREVKNNAMLQLADAKSVNFVMDQGAFAAENMLTMLADGREKGDFLIRSNISLDRAILNSFGETTKLLTLLSSEDIVDTRVVKIRALNHFSASAKKRVLRKARNGKLKLKFGDFFVIPTTSCSASCPQKPQKVYFVDVEEDISTVPKGEDPIHWCLVSSEPITSIEDAWRLVDLYMMRWFIEQLFRILKNRGFDVEHSDIKNPEAIKKLIVMALKASVDALQLVSARDNIELPIETQFNEEEQEILKSLNRTLEGNTVKKRNPYPDTSLAFGAWVIARLGGHSGCSYHKPPGPITMSEGLVAFRNLCWGNSVINKYPKNSCKDV
jgi:hypothetical protein